MITLTARVNLITFKNGGALLSASLNRETSNISAPLSNVVKTKKKGSNPFIFGASILGEGATFSDGEEYYIGNIPADENGSFIPQYTIGVNGNQISALTIVFDDYNNQFPTSITIDGETYLNDDPYFTVINLNPTNTHAIVINNWNTPNYPLRIQGIYVDLNLELDRRNMLNLDRSIFDRSDLELPSYGIISNTGNIEFNDLDGEIKDYAEMNLLQSGIDVEVYINNTLTKTNELIGKFNSSDWNYDNDNRQVTLSIKDDLEEWQDINIDGINYDPRTPVSQNLAYFYNYLYNFTPSKYNMLEYDELDSITKNILFNTVVQYPTLENGSLWDGWTKLCEVAQAHIYKDNEGNTVFKYLGGD